ncbi:MAG: ABC transporter permease [Dehalococcoidales bacterium]|nr:ABC transporter permease [Dehalococcoidales bacterium]
MAQRNRLSIILALLAILFVWQVTATLAGIAALPGPGAVASAFVQGLSRDLATHLAISSYRVVLSILLSVALAAPIGLALGQGKRLDRFIAPIIYLTYPVPKIVLLPIILIFLGIGEVSKVFIISIILFFQVLVVVRDASNGVRPELIHSVRSLGAGKVHLFRYVYLPACLPAILTSLRVSTGTAIAVLFFAESFATNSGLGYYIMVEGWGRMAYADMYAGVVAMSLLGLAIYYALDLTEKKLCAWIQAGQ